MEESLERRPEQEVSPEQMKTRIEKALEVAFWYGGTNEAHHKAWVIDQMVRELTGCPKVEKEALDVNGKPYTYEALGESDAYRTWVKEHNNGEDGPESYEWNEGIAP